jgi:hypothetical protein
MGTRRRYSDEPTGRTTGNLSSIPGEGEIDHYTVQTISGVTLSSIHWLHDTSPSAEIMNSRSYTSTPPYTFIADNGTDEPLPDSVSDTPSPI